MSGISEHWTFESVPLLRLAVCLMTGIVMGDVLISPVPLLPLFIGLFFVSLLLWKYAQLQSVAIAVCFVVLGWLLVDLQKRTLSVEWPAEEVCYEAVVLSEPVDKPKTVAVDVMLTGSRRKLKCYLYKDDRSRGLRIGDGLRLQSRIRANDDWRIGTFDYRRYLEIHGFTGSTFVASWKWQKTQVSLENLTRTERTRLWFLKWRSRLLDRLESALRVSHSDTYAVIAAMSLGDKSALSKELKEVYSVTGASHVLALSGLHLGIIYTLLSLLFARGRWRMVSQMVLILSIWAFVFLVGMSVSVVRSAVMLSVYALLSLGHRDKMSVNTLAFAAIVILMLSPLSLFDVGFQMSFMAVFSILVWMPLLETVFPQAWLLSHRAVWWIWQMVAVSLSAQIGVAPLIAYYFGRFSTLFLLTNFIVIPGTMLILYLTIAVLLLPGLAPFLAGVVVAQNSVLTHISRIPLASIDGLRPTMLQLVMVYVILTAMYLLILRMKGGKRKTAFLPI